MYTWLETIEWYLAGRDVCAQYAKEIRHRAGALEMAAGRVLGIDDVTDELVNWFLMQMQSEGKHYDKTVKGYRDAMQCVRQAAWEHGLTDVRPGRVRRIKVRRKLPSAWTIEEVRMLVKAAEKLPGKVAGIDVGRSLWFSAYVHLLWCTGLRVGDVLTIEWSAVFQRTKNDAAVYLVQSKQNHPVLCGLSARAVRLATDIRNRTDSPLVLPWPGARCILDRWFRRLVKRSGIRPGGTRWIRRGAASKVEQEQPGMASKFLGHLTPGLAAKHYLDPSITNQRPIRPPEL